MAWEMVSWLDNKKLLKNQGGVAMRWWKELAVKITALFKKVLGMGLWQASSWIYDNPLWLSVELYFGSIGVAILGIGAIGMNFGTLCHYRRKKVPWLCWDDAVNEVKSNPLKSYFQTVFFLGIIFWSSLIGAVCLVVFVGIIFLFLTKIIFKFRVFEDVFMFFLLSIQQDSFICTAYLRHGHADGISKRDWWVFAASSVVSIGYWSLRNGIIAEFILRPML